MKLRLRGFVITWWRIWGMQIDRPWWRRLYWTTVTWNRLGRGRWFRS